MFSANRDLGKQPARLGSPVRRRGKKPQVPPRPSQVRTTRMHLYAPRHDQRPVPAVQYATNDVQLEKLMTTTAASPTAAHRRGIGPGRAGRAGPLGATPPNQFQTRETGQGISTLLKDPTWREPQTEIGTHFFRPNGLPTY